VNGKSKSISSAEDDYLGVMCLRLQDFDLKGYRQELKLSQSAFAAQMNIPLDTLKKWEGGTSAPLFNGKFKDGWLQRQLRKVLLLRQ
jgi:DNA-binding transcriptional regulator YiaG